MSDPRNTIVEAPAALEWDEPTEDETGRFRQMIDLYRTDKAEYLRRIRDEDRFLPALLRRQAN